VGSAIGLGRATIRDQRCAACYPCTTFSTSTACNTTSFEANHHHHHTSQRSSGNSGGSSGGSIKQYNAFESITGSSKNCNASQNIIGILTCPTLFKGASNNTVVVTDNAWQPDTSYLAIS
jgi:hypothetical protein